MALQFFEGFDNDPAARLSLVGAGASRAVAGGRNGTDGWNINASTGYAAVPVSPGVGGTGTLLLGFAIKISGYGNSAANPLVAFDTAFNSQQTFVINTSGVIGFRLSASQVATASAAIPLNTWTYVEIQYTPHDTTGVAKVWLDGVLVMDYSGDTRHVTTTITNAFIGNNGSGWACVIDDLYVADGTGTVHNARLGDVHVKRLAPTGAGNYSQGLGSDGNSVDNHLLVDEAPASSADYVELDVNDRESYTVANLAAGEVPLAVKVAAQVGEGGGAATVDGFLRIGATDYDAGDDLPTSMAYKWRDFIFGTNPATATTWAEDDLDGAEFGVRRTA